MQSLHACPACLRGTALTVPSSLATADGLLTSNGDGYRNAVPLDTPLPPTPLMMRLATDAAEGRACTIGKEIGVMVG